MVFYKHFGMIAFVLLKWSRKLSLLFWGLYEFAAKKRLFSFPDSTALLHAPVALVLESGAC